MPRIIARRDVSRALQSEEPSEAFPEADFRFLVHVGAKHCARICRRSRAGPCPGRRQSRNLLVRPADRDCYAHRLRLISDRNRSNVSRVMLVSPYSQGRAFTGDRFEGSSGQPIMTGWPCRSPIPPLYMGRHPFAGRYSGPGRPAHEKAIAEYRFAYSPDRRANGIERLQARFA